MEYTRNPGKNILCHKLHNEILDSVQITKNLDSVTYNEEGDELVVIFDAALDAAEEAAMDSLIAAHDNTSYIENLVIKNFLSGQRGEIVDVNFATIGLSRGPFVYDKGEKKEHVFFADAEQTTPAVRRTFSDWYEDEDDGQGGTVSVWKGVNRHFEWLDYEGNTVLTKDEKQMYNHREKGAQKKKRRQRQIDNLIGGAEGTPIEGMVTAIFEHYKTETDNYLNSPNYTGLADAIINETDPTIIGYLDTVVGAPGNPNATVRDAILYEIT